MKRLKGFTLIELLIVVAIIAILAAIAVPNFLEAQTRSKVSRALADIRGLRLAVESYAVDHARYPTQWHGGQVQWPEIVSTPIAYVASTIGFQDVFQVQEGGYLDPYWRLYGYWYWKSYFELFQTTPLDVYRDHPKVDSYQLTSNGPDRIRGYFEYYGPYGKGVDGQTQPRMSMTRRTGR